MPSPATATLKAVVEDIDQVMGDQTDVVAVRHRLRPVFNDKGG